MLKKILKIVAIVILLVGIGLLAFPPVSNMYGTKVANDIADNFDYSVSHMDDEGTYEEALESGKIDVQGYPIDESGNRTSDKLKYYSADIKRLFADSMKYNNNLKKNQSSYLTDQYAYEVPSIDLTDYGIMDGIYGYVAAESIGMRLPIYLGANASTMSYGAAHLSYTSLPIGGVNTNTVLAGHTGYIGRIFFDNIRNLQPGDTVSVTNYWGTLNYTVQGAKIVAPDDAADIFITKDEDRLTLVTCIGDGDGGFDRYIVICKR